MKRDEPFTFEWVTELLAQVVTFFCCAAFFGLVGGIVYGLISLVRNFKFF